MPGYMLQIINGSEASLLCLCCLIALAWQAAGFAVSRQWFLLPLLVGISALCAFLLNPIADANSLLDLRTLFLQPATLLSLALAQVAVIGASLTVGISILSGKSSDRWRIALGILHCIPASPLLLAALLTQQFWLSVQVGARPEWTGIMSAVGVAGLLLVSCGLAWLLSSLQRTQLFFLSSLTFATLVCVVTSNSTALPPTGQVASIQSAVVAVVPLLVLAIACGAIGMLLQRKSHQNNAFRTVLFINQNEIREFECNS